MKFKEMSLGALALCVLIMSLSSCADGSETPKKGGKTGPAILMSLSVSEAPVVHRTVELTLTVTPAISAENATIDIALPSGITRVSGDLRWKGKLVYNKPFDVKSQIQVAEAGEWKIEAKATARSVKDTYENTSVLYIQASDTTAKVFHGPPQFEPQPRGTDIGKKLTESPIGKAQETSKLPSKYVPSEKATGDIQKDTGQVRPLTTLRAKTAKVDERKKPETTGVKEDIEETFRRLSAAPLENADEEALLKDGQIWIRRRGEKEFRLAPVVTSVEEDMRRAKDSVDPIKKLSTFYNIEINVRDSSTRKTLQDMGIQIPDDQIGWIRKRISKADIENLQKHGIQFREEGEVKPLHFQEGDDNNDFKRSPVDQDSTKEGSLPLDVIFSENFEGDFPGSRWVVGDNNSGSGRDYWDDVNCESHGVGWSCWCADIGDMPDCGNYDDEMDAYFKNASGINVEGYTDVQLKYWLRYETEPNWDFYRRYYSANGTDWTLSEEYDGRNSNWPDWNQRIYNLHGFTDYWVKFVFWSDGSIHGYEGAYVDDIEIVGEPTRLPNLTCYTPSGWDGPIVASSVPGTHTNGPDLTAGQTTYIDWAVINDGEVDITETFYTELYVDGGRIGRWYTPGLPSGWYAYVEDYEYEVSEGSHTLKIVADVDDDVRESDETDNECSETFYWNPEVGEITVIGSFHFYDDNEFSYEALRYATVELWDEDLFGDDLLDISNTDQDGEYTLGPVSNEDGEGGTQDIYVRVYAETQACQVVDDGNDIWRYRTETVWNVPDGVYDFGAWTAPDAHDGAYNIYDVLIDGYQWVDNRPGTVPPEQVTAKWYPGYTQGTWFDPNTGWIHIRGDNNPDYYTPDEWDNGIILHEYGHYIAWIYDIDNSPGGPHAWHGIYSDALGWSEGWAHYIACIVRGLHSYRDSWSGGTRWVEYNVETGIATRHDGQWWDGNSNGSGCEAAVAGIVWDVDDDVDDNQQRDGRGGVGDTLSTGSDLIWDVIKNYSTGGHGVYEIFEFWDGWFARRHAHGQGMWDVYFEHGLVQPGIAGNLTSATPGVFTLSQNYPNPFNPITKISYCLPKPCTVQLAVYDLLGRKVTTLVEKPQKPGYHTATCDASGFSSGIYFYKLTAGEYSEVNRMTLLK